MKLYDVVELELNVFQNKLLILCYNLKAHNSTTVIVSCCRILLHRTESTK